MNIQNKIPKDWQKEKLELKDYGLYKPVFPQEWEQKSLYSLAKWINGRAFKNSDFDSIGLPILKIAEIKNGVSSQTNFTKKDYGGEVLIKKGDILFPWSGTPETSIDILIWNGPKGWLNQHTFKVVPTSNIDEDFFYYLLRYLKVNFIKIASNKQTTGLGHVTVNDLKNLDIRLPDLVLQEKIASVLSAFDDKIEVNNKIAKTLEEIAQALFKEWFIKFKYPFGKLSDVAKITMGQSPLSKFYNNKGEGLPFHQGVTNFGNRFPNHEVYCTENNRVAEKGDILFSVRAPVGRLNIANAKISLGRGVASIRHKNNYQSFIYYLLERLFKKEDSLGGGSVFPSVTKDDMEGMRILIPNEEVIKKFENIVSVLDIKIGLVEKENQKLAALRDLLLPKLMRGEVRV